MHLSILIPAYHEGNSLSQVLREIQELIFREFECLIIIDDSDDPSQKYVRSVSDEDSRFKLTLNKFGPGPSGALKTGFSEAKGNVIVVLSADGSEDISQVPEMVSLIEKGASIVAASRFMRGGNLINSPLIKGILSRLASLALDLFLKIGTKDSTNNFKAYSKEFIKSIDIESNKGFEVALELVVKAYRKNAKIVEIPTTWIERQEGESTFDVYKALIPYSSWFVYAFIGKRIF